MSFVDELRRARTSRVAAFHEFEIDYVPGSGRVYAFFEGHDDRSFYVTYLQARVPDIRLLRTYRCDSKAGVYAARDYILRKHRDPERVLFFVDKDLSDVLGEVYPVDEKVFTTEYYSVENYLVCTDIVARVVPEFFRMNRVNFEIEPILRKFNDELARFHARVGITIAWIVAARRAGLKPVAANIRMSDLFEVDTDLTIKRKGRAREAYYEAAAGVAAGVVTWHNVRAELDILRCLDAKKYVRGKYEAWFLIQFLRRLEEQLRQLAKEAGGSVSVKTTIHAENFVEVLASRLAAPADLNAFLDQNLNAA